MMIQVTLFAAARQAVGHESIDIELIDGGTVGDLREAIAAQFPQLGDVLSHSMFAVGTDYCGDDHVIESRAAVSLIPPVSGG